MPSSRFNRRLLALSALLTLPVAGIFLFLVVNDEVRFLTAFLSCLGSLALTLLLLHPYVGDLMALSNHMRELARGEDSRPPNPRSNAGAELLGALGQLRRASRGKVEEAAARIDFHETLFESLPPPLFLLSGQRKILRANLAARKIFGRQLQDRDLAAVLRNPPLLDAAEKVLAGEPGREVEFTLAGPAEREFLAMLEPLTADGENGATAVLTLHDVSTLRQMERMRADFVANASHELRTPLAAVLGFIETLQGPAKDDPEAHERFLAIMYEQASRMSRLVADLLNLSRIEMNEHTRPIQKVAVAATLERVAAGLEVTAQRRNMKLVLDITDPSAEVMGQEDELAQVFQNLMDNALKYGRETTPVEVALSTTDKLPPALAGKCTKAVKISVCDHGEGIAREHLPRLTERFFRVDTARSRQLGGTGLGLAIVKHVMNRHRGILTIDSTLGQGSTFSVYLPAAER